MIKEIKWSKSGFHNLSIVNLWITLPRFTSQQASLSDSLYYSFFMSKTTRPLSTISYNTFDFLKGKLEDLEKRGDIDFWCFIKHFGETNEDGSKEKLHYHVYIVPATSLDRRQLRQEFIQFYKNESLPRGFMPMQPSNWQDWYLYGLHDREYLQAKGQSREYSYSDQDMVRSDDTYYWDAVHRIDRTRINPLGEVVRAAQSGITFAEFITSHQLSLLQVRSAQFVFQQVQGGAAFRSLDRAGRHNHEPIDPDTGEYISPIDIPD